MLRKWLCIGVLIAMSMLTGSNIAFCAQDLEVLVARGDTLINICKDYLEETDDWPQVAGANPHIKDPNWIYPGQKLVIPAILLKGVPGGGRVSFLKGTVDIQRTEDKPWENLAPGEQLIEGIRIRTGEDGILEVTFEDASNFYMKPGTCVQVLKARKSGASGIIGELFLEGGRIITRIKKATGSEPRFKIQTPSAAAAIRGTEFRVSHDLRNSTRIEVLAGLVAARGRQRKVLLEEGTGTVIKKGREPEKPAELLPPPKPAAPEPLYRKMPIEFRFETIKGTSAIRALLARDAEIKDVIREIVSRPDEAAAMTDIADGSYYLQVAGIDGKGLEGLPSSAIPIHVRVNPVPPFVQSPVNGKEYKTVSMEFSWLNVKDAVGYQMQIAEDPSFLKIVDDRELTGKVDYKTRRLEPKTYYFRVLSIAEDGYRGLWSDVLRFALLQPPPAPVSEPPKKSGKQITIQWQNIGPGYSYHFQMARDEEFSEIVVDKNVDEPSITFAKPKKAGTYHVRASAINTEGFEGHFSAPQSFKIKRFPWELLGPGAMVGAIIFLAL
ncbi:MAG: FecR domain-containing protein [Syntrophobacteraceae bacterium]